MNITKCRVNHIQNPMGYQLARPVFSWVTENAAGKRQETARLRVLANREDPETAGGSGNPGKYEKGTMLYDSGWAELDSLATEADICLMPRTRYSWTVSVRSDAGEEAESEVNTFETGKMNEPWEGRWIGCDKHEKRLPVFHKKFTMPEKEIRTARLYICGLGLYRADLNGQRIGEERLTPYCNNYDKWVQAQTYDITEQLGKENELCVTLGNGWYKGRFGFTSKGGDRGFYGDEWKLIAELRISFADGTEKVIGTDEDWTVTRSRITFSNIYDGERRDDTLPELPEERAFLLAETLPLQDRLSVPVRVQETVEPIELLHTPAGEWVYDLGQNLAGSFRLRVHEPKGTKIHVQVGEVLQGGNFYRDNLRTALAEYIYISDGEAHVLEPEFTFYGFRYAKVSGIPEPGKEDFTALVFYSDIFPAGKLVTGQQKINQLISNIRWGQKGNFIDVPTDCPQRDERMGWTADCQVFTPTACFFADSAAFYRKYLYDLRTEQEQFDGMVPDMIPSAGHPGQGSSVWGDAATIIPWDLYLFTGDKKYLEDAYDSMKAWVDYIRREDGDDRGYARHWHYGDWVALDNPAGGVDQVKGGTEDAFIAYVYYMYSAQLTARAAGILGKPEDERHYSALAEEIHRYILDEYYTPNGRCAINTQTGYVLTLFYRLNENRRKALESLKDLIHAKGDKLVTGFVGTPLIQHVLSGEGENRLAYKILFNEEYPGWLYEVNLGATTVWERWNSMEADGSVSSTGMNSFNHYAYGSIGEWMWRVAAGINPTEEEPGFRKVILSPVPSAKLHCLRADYDSPAGRYHVEWEVKDANHVFLKVSVPFNCRAILQLPWAGETDRELASGEYTYALRTKEPLILTHSTAEPLGQLLDNPRTKAALKETDSSLLGIPHAEWGKTLQEILSDRTGGEELIRKLDQTLKEIREE